MQSLRNSSQISSELTPKNDGISIYKGELTTKCIIENVAKIKKSFPSLPLGFYDILTDRLHANGFSDARLSDAVSHVIDTFIYPTPTIASFISFDRRVKTYTYHQYVKLIEEGENGNNYKPIKLKDRPALVWMHVNDIELYHIQSEPFESVAE